VLGGEGEFCNRCCPFMLESVLGCCDEFERCVECRCFEIPVELCGFVAGEGCAGDATGVSGEFGCFCVASDCGGHLLQ